MKHSLILTLAWSALLAPLATAAPSSKNGPLEIKDVPRATQFGTGKPEGNSRYVAPMPESAKLPTLWLIGDSTVRNGTMGENPADGQWGWGAPLTGYFDLKKINLVNRAMGGTSSRTFYNGNWKDMKSLIKKGDIVIMQFGANDDGKANGKGGLNGTGDETAMNNDETVHTFGWYLKQFVAETREQGGTPILCSLTPRKRWSEDGKQFNGGDGHVGWTQEIAKTTNSPYIPLNEIISSTYQEMGKDKVDGMFPKPDEKLHTGWAGAIVNAECVVSGLKALPGNPMSAFFSPRASSIQPSKVVVK